MAFSRRKTITLLGFIVAVAACSKNEEPKVLARVGDVKITVDEFRKRFELNPRLGQYKDINQAKACFLGSLIAEKLLALDADQQGLMNSSRMNAFLDQINREAVIEEFYNTKIASQIQIDEKEVRQAYAMLKKELEVQYTSFKTIEEARKFRERLLAGESFEDALLNFSLKERNHWMGVDTLTLKWGITTPTIEEALYNLKPGEVSEPIAALNEFFIARILSEEIDAFGTEHDFHANRGKIEKILTKRKRSSEFVKHFKEMMIGKKTEVPPERLKYLAESLEAAFAIGEGSTDYVRTINPSPINEVELLQAQQSLETNLNETLVTFDDGTSWTIREFLQRLSVGRYHLDFNTKKDFRLGLRQAIITMIEQEYVYKMALKEELHQSPSVDDEVEMWRESLAAQKLVQRILSYDNKPQDEQESIYLTNAQLTILSNKLFALSRLYHIEIDLETFNALQVSNAGLLVVKTHFPGRLVVPVGIPLENLSIWQDKILEMIGPFSTTQ